MRNPTDALAAVRNIIDLPSAVTTLLDRLHKLAAVGATIEEPETPEATNRRLDRGHSPLDIARDLAEYEQAKALAKAAHRIVREARETTATLQFPQVVNEHRDPIIEGPLREKVTALIEDTRPHAEALAVFAPGFDGAHIAAHGTPKQLKAYQAALGNQATFDALVRLYRSLVTPKAAGSVYSPHIGGEGAWGNPEAVPVAYRGQHWRRDPHQDDRTPAPSALLLIASQSEEGGYRLASVRELEEAYRVAEAQAVAEFNRTVTRTKASF